MKLLLVFSDYSFPNLDGPSAQLDTLLEHLCLNGVDVSLVIYHKETSFFDISSFSVKFPTVSILNVIIYKGTFIGKSMSISVLNDGKVFFEKLSVEFERVMLVGFAVFPVSRYFRNSKVFFNVMDAWSFRMLKLSIGSGLVGFLKYFSAFIISYIFEIWYERYVDYFIFVSDKEVDSFKLLHPLSRRKLVGISLFSISIKRRSPQKLLNRCLIWGDVGVPYIREGIIEIVPILTELASSTYQIDVLGRQPSESISANLVKNLGTNYIDWLNDLSSIENYDFVIIPDSNGSGIKNRIISCFSLGVPVVTSIQAFSGFPEEIRNFAISVYDSGNIKECLAGMFNPSHLSEVSANAFDYVRSSHDNLIIYRRWHDLLFC